MIRNYYYQMQNKAEHLGSYKSNFVVEEQPCTTELTVKITFSTHKARTIRSRLSFFK